MIRRPPRSTRTDTLVSLHSAVQISDRPGRRADGGRSPPRDRDHPGAGSGRRRAADSPRPPVRRIGHVPRATRRRRDRAARPDRDTPRADPWPPRSPPPRRTTSAGGTTRPPRPPPPHHGRHWPDSTSYRTTPRLARSV